MRRTLLRTTTAAAIISTFATSAFAVDADAVFERLKAQMEYQGVDLKADSVTEEDGGVLLKGVTLGTDAAPFKLDSIVLADVVEAQNGGFAVGTVGIPAFNGSSDGVNFDFGGAEIEQYFIAGAAETDPLLKGNMYSKMTVGPVAIGPDGQVAFSMSGAVANMSPYQPGGTMEYDMTVNDMMVDFSTSPDARTRETMEQLGYSQVKGELTAEGMWNTDSGVLTMKPMKLAADDAADLSFELEIGGYTPELVAGMQEMQKSMKGNEQAASMAMLGMMQQLDVRQLAIAVDDNSLTGRLLDFFGGQQGMNRESTVAFAKGMLPLGLAQIGNPEFAAKASAAIGQFLSDPKSLRIEAAPPAPVPVAQIMAGASTNPGSLIDTLAVTIKANE